MIKYIGKAWPTPSKGVDYSDEIVITVPDQSMSLQEILERFTRGESLPIEHEGSEGETDLGFDLEKMRSVDLVDRQEFIDKMKDIQNRYADKERAEKNALEQKEQAEKKAALEKEIREKIELEKSSNSSVTP